MTGQPTAVFHYPTACGTAANNWTSSTPYYTTTAYDSYGNSIASSDADANAGISGAGRMERRRREHRLGWISSRAGGTDETTAAVTGG